MSHCEAASGHECDRSNEVVEAKIPTWKPLNRLCSKVIPEGPPLLLPVPNKNGVGNSALSNGSGFGQAGQ